MTTKTKPIPVTKEEKLLFVEAISDKFQRKGELLLPDDELYPQKFTEFNLEKICKKVFYWLGVKPINLSYKIDETSSFACEDNHCRISLSKKHAEQTFVGAAFLSKFCLEYYFYKHKQRYDDELLEMALIELGLGMPIINAINSDDSLKAKINRVIVSHKPSLELGLLNHYTVKEYSRLFNEFIVKSELPAKTVWEHSLPWSAPYGVPIKDVFGKVNYQPFVESALALRRDHKFKLLGLGFATSCIFVLSAFLIMNAPKKLSPEMQVQKDKIETLRLAYNACNQSLELTKKEQTTSDIFALQHLDSEIARCTSLANKYDFEVRDYNAKLEKAGLE